MNKQCEQTQIMLPQAVQGELDEAARAGVLRHAEDCPTCAEALHFQQRLQRALTRDPLAAPPPLYFEGVLEEIHRAMPPIATERPRPRRRQFDRQALGTTALAALMLIWIGTWLPAMVHGGGLQGFGSHIQRVMAQTHAADPAAPSRPIASNLVLVKDYGLVTANSEYLKYTPAMRRELGLAEEKPKALLTLRFQG